MDLEVNPEMAPSALYFLAVQDAKKVPLTSDFGFLASKNSHEYRTEPILKVSVRVHSRPLLVASVQSTLGKYLFLNFFLKDLETFD